MRLVRIPFATRMMAESFARHLKEEPTITNVETRETERGWIVTYLDHAWPKAQAEEWPEAILN